MTPETYVLITAARNEEVYIEKTIQSVISQTVLPQKWVIVSDGSTDRTDEIVKDYAKKNDFIELVQKPSDSDRNFGSKAKAIKLGYERLKELKYEYIGNLDADVSFDSLYYENILKKFWYNKKLGIAGGIRYDLCNGKFKKIISARNSVGGPFQLFRRECYETIGGYSPLKYGGIDAVAEIKARMYGWEVKSFPEDIVYHHRCTGTAKGSTINAAFRAGIRDYLIGYHPLFQTVRCLLYRTLHKPYLLYGIVWMSGYVWASFHRYKRPVSDDFVKYLRTEQLMRLQTVFFTPKDNILKMQK